MFVRSLCVLVITSTAVCVAAPVPKSLKSRVRVDTARFQVEYTNATIDNVLEDFEKETGLRWVGDRPALGAVTLWMHWEHTTGEYIDLLNERMAKENYSLVRHADTFYLHPTDQPIDPEKVDTVSLEDITPRREFIRPADGELELGHWKNGKWVPGGKPAAPRVKVVPAKRGQTEVVALVIEMPGNLQFADLHPIKVKALSKVGRCEPTDNGREVRVTARADNMPFVSAILNGN